jgi:DNA-binding HxlR family transcriptional regulator
MAKNGRKEAEDIILQALGHTERRGILRIIGANPDGVTYSSILGETELNTGHLNYHLRSLEGLIEKTDDRLYRLTPLGQKALGVMNNLSNEIDNEAIRYIEVAKSSQEGTIHPFVKGLLYIGIVAVGIAFLASFGLLISSVTRGSMSIMGSFAALAMMCFTGAILWVLINALKTVPDFVKRLERKLLKD